MDRELSVIEIELQNKVRAFSDGQVKYLVLDDSGWGRDVTYCLGEEGLKGIHLSGASADHIIEWCRKDTSDQIQNGLIAPKSTPSNTNKIIRRNNAYSICADQKADFRRIRELVSRKFLSEV